MMVQRKLDGIDPLDNGLGFCFFLGSSTRKSFSFGRNFSATAPFSEEVGDSPAGVLVGVTRTSLQPGTLGHAIQAGRVSI